MIEFYFNFRIYWKFKSI